ncbi:MAG: hypothetical protein ACR2JY_04315 [Chloroflexota bacterium]
MAMSKQEFMRVLTAERRQAVLGVIRSGLAIYDDPINYGGDARRDHSPIVQAQIRSAHIQGEAKRDFIEQDDIRLIQRRGRLIFRIADCVDISFKKLNLKPNGTLRPTYSPTQQALNFLTQRPLEQPPLLPDGMPSPVTNVVAGYVFTDPAATEYEVHIICPAGPDNQWELNLSGSDVVEFLSAPDASPTLVDAERKVRVRIRTSNKEASLNGSVE